MLSCEAAKHLFTGVETLRSQQTLPQGDR